MLVGREAELAAIGQFLDPGQEDLSALLLEGEAGIGKTCMWRAGRSAARSHGLRLLGSAPTEAEAGLPYAVLGDLLDPIPEEGLACLSSPLRSALEMALLRAPAEHAPAEQLAVSAAFLRVLRQLASDRPILLAIDDLQWVDGPTMRVLAFALHRLDHDRVKVLATVRRPSTSDAESALQTALGHSRLRRLEIGPLSLNAIDDLLLQRLERPLRRPELDHVYAVSGGNPFFALEIGRLVLEHPTSRRTGEPIAVPASLAEAIKARVKKLPRETRDILVGLAALSRPDEALLQRANRHAMVALKPAFDAQVVEPSERRVRFTHPLLASVIYGMADPETRRRWHSRLAELVGEAEERARHLALSAIGPDAGVASAVEDAAKAANARGAPDAAAQLAQQASELTPPHLQPAIVRRRIMTAEYRLRAGDVPGARALLEAELDSSAAGKRPAAALRLMGSLTLGGADLVQAERFLTEALDQSGDDLHLQALIERDLITVLSQRGKLKEAFDHSVRLSEIATRSDDPSLVALAQRLRATAEYRLGAPSAEALATAIALADGRSSVPIDDHTGGLHPLMLWATLLKGSDDFARARTLLKRALELTEGRDESLRAPILFHLAEMECWAGDWLLAAVYAHECEKSVLHAGHGSYVHLPICARAMIHCGRGQLEAGRSAAQQVLAIATTMGDEPYHRRALAILGSTEFAAGDPVAANRYFDSLRARGDYQGYRGVVRTDGDEVETLLAVGRIADAEVVCERLVLGDHPWQRAIGARGRALVAAACGDLERSADEFELALAKHHDLAMPLERARTLLCYARLLRRTKRKRAAREKLEDALEIFKSLGTSTWIERATAEHARITPSSPGVSGLTPTEARVAALVAGGRTNREVAAELFLTVKTVEANLSRIYDKLDVRSRTQLVGYMASHR